MMRRWNWIVVVAAVAGGLWLMQDILFGADRTRIFVTFVSHNEESISNPPCAPVMTDPVRFAANRTAVLSLAQVMNANRTQGLNLVHFLNTFAPGHIEVDAHSHEKRGYNYADVAYILSYLNVPPNGIVGGFVVNPPANETWTRLREPLAGLKYKDYTWQATTLWGGASAGHRNDSNASGIWRPKGWNEFEVDDPSQDLLAVGNYPGAGTSNDAASILALVEQLRQGRLESGRMYTATIMVPQCELDSNPALISSVGLLIDQLQADVDRGDVVWATLTEMVRVWREDYGSQPLVVHP